MTSFDQAGELRHTRSQGMVMRFQFSVASLIGIVLGVGFLLAGLINPSDLLGSSALTLMVTLLVIALLGVTFRAGPERHFWFGFAIFGWTYVFLVFSETFRAEIGLQLLTTRLLMWVGASRMYEPTPAGQSLTNFYRFGHSVMGILVALLGGVLARFHFAAGEQREGESSYVEHPGPRDKAV